MNWVSLSSMFVDALVVVAFVMFTYLGYRKGLTKLIIQVISFIISLLIVFVVYKPVTNLVVEKTSVDEWLNSKIVSVLDKTEVAKGKEIEEDSTNISKSVVKEINVLVKESVSKAKDNTITYVAERLTYLIVEILVIIALLALTRIVLGIIEALASFVVALPFLHAIDKSGGLVYGAIKGAIIIYLVLAIISILSPMLSQTRVIKTINDSKIASNLYNNNIILNWISK